MILETKRLLLRNFEHDDLNSLFDYRNDINCAKYQRWSDTSREYLESLIEKNKHKMIQGETVQLAIVLNSTNELIGDIYICFKNKTITLGYTISPKYQRQGYAYEIIQSLTHYLFENFKKYEIVCLVNPDNEASKRLLEKLNFKNEGYVEEIESIVYCLDKGINKEV